MTNTNITDEILKKIDYFRSSPDTARRILELIDIPGTGTGEILALLEFDIPITANVLKRCNSSSFTSCGEIHSIKEAVECIGLAELKTIITMSASSRIFAVGGGGYEAGIGEMRRHSIATAVISKYLHPYLPPITGDLFTACLLHDIGKLVLSDYIGEHYREIVRLIEDDGYDFAQAEEKIIGMTHAEVGARILEKWNFPTEMITAVRNHHDPELVPQSSLTHFVTLADQVAMILGFTTAADGLGYRGFPNLYKKYKMKESDIEGIAANAIDEIKKAIPYNGDPVQKEQKGKE